MRPEPEGEVEGRVVSAVLLVAVLQLGALRRLLLTLAKPVGNSAALC